MSLAVRLTALRFGLAWLTLSCCMAAAHAQLAGSVGVASEQRYRGTALSDDEAAPQLSLNYDAENGTYVGLGASRARLDYTKVDAQATMYAGFARRLKGNMSWDAGISDRRFRGGARYNYRELYAGVSGERLSARLSWSPHYFGLSGQTIYAEINGSHALMRRLELVGHVGYLRPLGKTTEWIYRQSARPDIRLGLNASLAPYTVQLDWVATRAASGFYPGVAQQDTHSIVLSASYSF